MSINHVFPLVLQQERQLMGRATFDGKGSSINTTSAAHWKHNGKNNTQGN